MASTSPVPVRHLLFVSAFLFAADNANALSINPFRGRSQLGHPRHQQPAVMSTNTSPSSSASSSSTVRQPTDNSAVDSRLFYKNDGSSSSDEDAIVADMSGSVVALSSASPMASSPISINNNKPRSIFLPRRTSPSREQLERRRHLLDAELVIGRFAMLTAIIVVVGELMTQFQLQ